MSARIEFQDLTLGYDRHPAVHHLTGAIEPGSLLAVVGPNGAGKSTLLKGVVGMLQPIGGRVKLQGVTPHDIAYLPQLADIDRSFPVCVYDFVSMGLWRTVGIFGRIGRDRRDRIETAIRAVGLEGFERRAIGTLSGGQMQRCMFARLLLQDSPVILLDEPFNAVDTKTVTDLIELIHRWHAEKRTVVTVLHDLETVRRHFPEAVLMAREVIAWGRTAEVLTPANLLAARRMIEAFDDQAHACARDVA